MTTRGSFIVFEGGDGVGKSTQTRLLAESLTEQGYQVVSTFEPGDSTIGPGLRKLLLDPATRTLDPRTETLLYAADKAQHLFEVVQPALAAGKIVVCDRYLDSLIAYQGAGRDQSSAQVSQIASWATRGLRPDLTILLDADPAQAHVELSAQDRLESAGLDFHRRVRQQFLQLAASASDYLVVPAHQSPDEIAATIGRAVAGIIAPI